MKIDSSNGSARTTIRKAATIRVNTKKIQGIPEAYVTIFKYGWLLSIDDGVGSVFAETGSLIDGMGDQKGCSLGCDSASLYELAVILYLQ